MDSETKSGVEEEVVMFDWLAECRECLEVEEDEEDDPGVFM